MQVAAQLEQFRERRGLLGASLAVLVVLLYAPAIHYGFLTLWDDDSYVTDNPHVRSGLTLTNIRWAFSSFEQSNWHPVAWLSHMVDCQLFGLNPGPQHFVNVLLHAANVFLLFWLLQKATGAVWRSFFVAALFAAHPLNVETVAWIAQRKSLLSAFFSLLTIAAYGWYVQQRNWKRYALLLAGFALAVMAKPMAVSLPLLMLLFDCWPLRRFEERSFLRRWTRLTIEKLPLFVMSAASSVLTEMAQNSGGSVMGLSLLPISGRVENVLISYVAYIGKILWPARLATYYPIQLSPHAGAAVAAAAILIAISAAVLYFRQFPYLAVGWFFYLIAMVPVIGIVQVGFQGMADRYTYVPAVGLFIALVWGLAEIAARLHSSRTLLAFGGLCVIAALGIATARYLQCWRDPVSLFARARTSWAKPDFWLEQLYGNALFSAGHPDDALPHYQESCRLQPRTEYCHYNIAHILSGRGQYPEAVGQYQLALRYTASRDMALLCLDESGGDLVQMGEYAAAQQALTRALEINPADVMARQLLEEIATHGGGAN
ncbi:MAG TPA: tetratricopeptide repeat protein [Verrucomicrobiae bacterium]|nr:tetratricopeptide repeat protein [Verrucomicrobiae bacterium]